MFVRVHKRTRADGSKVYYAAIDRNDRVKGKVVQTTIAALGEVYEEQIPYLKAAYAKDKPKLVWPDGREYCPGDPIGL
jgi:hypothetical protein